MKGHFAQVRLATLVTLGGVLAVFVVVMQHYWQAVSLDIAVYWEAGERMRAGAADLYKEPTDPANDVGRFIYPPAFAVFFAPLTLLPRWLGYGVWGLMQLAAIGLTLRALLGLCRVPRGQRADFALLVLLAVFGAAWENIREGQVNFLVMACVSLGLWSVVEGRSWRGGLWLALAAHLKIIPGVLLAVLLLQRRFKAALAMALGLGLIWFSPLVWTWPALGAGAAFERNADLTRQYLAEVAGPRVKKQQATDVGGPRAPNNALSAVAQRYFNDVQASNLTSQRGPLLYLAPGPEARWGGFALAALLYLLALLLAFVRQGEEGFTAACGLALTAATLGNLLCWPHHFAVLALLVAPLAALGLRDEKHLRRAVTTVAVMVLFCHVTLIPELEPLQIWGLPTAGAIFAWGVCFYTFWRGHGTKPTTPEAA